MISLVCGLTIHALMPVATVLTAPSTSVKRHHNVETNVRNYLEQQDVQALVHTVRGPAPYAGAEHLVEVYGMGPLMPTRFSMRYGSRPLRT